MLPGVVETVRDVLVFAVGVVIVALTLGSAVRTVVLPRGVPAKLASFVFITMRRLFDLRLKRVDSYEKRDRVMALYAPLSLFMLAAHWLFLVFFAYGLMFWSLGVRPVRTAFIESGSSLFTLGFIRPEDLPGVGLVFTEAGLGLTLAALLITYLPTLYTAFSRREAMVTALEVRANTPPSGIEMILRFYRIKWLEELGEVFAEWETWFVELEETHTSLPALVFFRSPQPDHSWVTAAGAVLDAAALRLSCLPGREPRASLALRAGYIALQRIAGFFGIPFDSDPKPDDPIAVAKEEFFEAYDRLADEGIEVVPDREQAWLDFRGWRVNYDRTLITLAALVMAPYAPWSSDRSAFFRARVLRRPAWPERRGRPGR
ncbi:MAG: hypothetical protein ACRD12_06750 [Acidimicrobiales bacterium]